MHSYDILFVSLPVGRYEVIPVGRPVIEIDEVQLEKLASFGCTYEEMASFFECSRDTLERRYAAIVDKARATGKIRLRKLQLQAAEKGNTAILIWLGKQMLGQRDKVEHSVDENAPPVITLKYNLENEQ